MNSKRKTSELWKFFDPIDENYATCNMCKQKFSYKTSTSNLKKHLKTKHPTVTIPTSDRTNASSRDNVSKIELIIKVIVIFLFMFIA